MSGAANLERGGGGVHQRPKLIAKVKIDLDREPLHVYLVHPSRSLYQGWPSIMGGSTVISLPEFTVFD